MLGFIQPQISYEMKQFLYTFVTADTPIIFYMLDLHCSSRLSPVLQGCILLTQFCAIFTKH